MFKGSFTALITPFKDGKVDEEAFARLVEWQIAEGTHGLVPCGTTGESPTLSTEEHKRVIALCVEVAKKRVPIVAGCGSNSTEEAIDLTRFAKQAGADASLQVMPYYNKPTQEGIYAHYAAIAEATRFPLVLYNIPGRTASNIAPEIIGRLARLEHVVGVKEASGSLDQMAHVVAKCPADFAVLSGDDSLTLPLLAIGGKGVISTTSNVAPRQMGDLVRLFTFLYTAEDPVSGLVEREVDHVFAGRVEGELRPCAEEVAAVAFEPFDEVERSCVQRPERFTPWFPIALRELRARGFVEAWTAPL